MFGYVYIIQSQKNGRYYVGSSEDPTRRLDEFHNLGKVSATKGGLPWKMMFVKEYGTISEARKIEYKLKQKKSRVILELVIKNNKLDIK